jgi:dihydroorotase
MLVCDVSILKHVRSNNIINLKHTLTCEGSWQAAYMLPNLSNVVTALADRELLRVEVLGS